MLFIVSYTMKMPIDTSSLRENTKIFLKKSSKYNSLVLNKMRNVLFKKLHILIDINKFNKVFGVLIE